MMKQRRLTCLFLAFGLIAAVATPTFADSDDLVGSWSSVAVNDATGQSDPFLATFNSDGTWISSGSNAGGSTAHGAWKKADSDTFTTISEAYLFDPGGGLGLTGTATAVLQVSADGNTHSGAFEAKIRLPDGTLIATVTGTITATRITVDSDDDSDSD